MEADYRHPGARQSPMCPDANCRLHRGYAGLACGPCENGGALVSTVGWSHVLHAEYCLAVLVKNAGQTINANYDEELALAA